MDAGKLAREQDADSLSAGQTRNTRVGIQDLCHQIPYDTLHHGY